MNIAKQSFAQIAGSSVNDTCTKNDSPPQNKTAHDPEQYSNENHNSLPANLNTNEGEFQNQSYDVCNASTSLESTDDPHVASQQQTELTEKSSSGEFKNKYNSSELLRSQGAGELATPVNNVGKLESEYLIQNYFSDSSDNAEARQVKGEIPLTFPSVPSGISFTNKSFRKNVVTGKTEAHNKPQTPNKFLAKICRKCRRYFFKEWTFKAHMEENCNPRKPYKCRECDEIFPNISELVSHRKMHTGVQDSFHNAEDRQEKVNMPSSSSSLPRRNPSISKCFGENVVTAAQQDPQTSKKQEKRKKKSCKKCGKYFLKDETFLAHVQSNCHPMPFKCGKCDERFSCMYSLSTHQRVHTGEKPFKCNQCGYASAWPQNLKTHLEEHT